MGQNKGQAGRELGQALGQMFVHIGRQQERIAATAPRGLGKTTAMATKAQEQRKNKMLVERTPNGQYFIYPLGKGPQDGIACTALDGKVLQALTVLYAERDQEKAMNVERPADEELQ